MLVAVMHFIPEFDDAQQIVARLLGAVAPGSFLVLSHAASDIAAEEMAEMVRRLNEQLVEPGVVRVPDWRPDTELEATSPAALWGGVARKPPS
jgi:hypothetical protein